MGAQHAQLLQSTGLTGLLCDHMVCGKGGHEFLFHKSRLVCIAVLFFCVVLPAYMERKLPIVRIYNNTSPRISYLEVSKVLQKGKSTEKPKYNQTSRSAGELWQPAASWAPSQRSVLWAEWYLTMRASKGDVTTELLPTVGDSWSSCI